MNCEFCQISKTFCRCYTCRSNCEPLSLCQNCDKDIHTQEGHALDSNIVQKLITLNMQTDFENQHVRGLLCSECEMENAYGYCKSCEQYMCQACSKSIHNKGARLRHVLDSTVLTFEGYSNPQEIETSIRNQSAKRQSESLKLSNLPRNETDQETLDILDKQKDHQIENSNTILHTRSLLATLPQSVYRENQCDKEEVKQEKYEMKTSLLQIAVDKLAEVNLQTGSTEFQTRDTSELNQQIHQSDTLSQISVPIYQPVFIDSQDPFLTMLMLLFREQGAIGNLMINYHAILNLIQSQMHLSVREAKELLLKSEQRGYIQVTVRNFGCIKSLTLISMKLPFITCESIQWVLGSLKKDGMDSNERAIQSRIKEAFSVKINSQLWQSILDSLESIKEPMHLTQFDQQISNLKNFKEIKHQYEMKYISSFKLPNSQGSKTIRFFVKPIEKTEETEGTQKVVHIFLKGDRYLGQDQQFNNERLLENPTDKQVYLEFKNFMEEYFLTNKYDSTDSEQRELDERDEVLQMLKKNSIGQKSVKNQRAVQKGSSGSDKYIPQVTQSAGSSDSQSMKNNQNCSLGDFNDDGKAIPGGRYGCAQFVKLCGTQFLKEQSLGKLACMVQKCINEDFLRYQRTLLVLTDCIDKTKVAPQGQYAVMNESSLDQLRQMQLKKAEIGAKLNAVKQSIIEVLAEHKQGVSLPQLPIFLKKKLPFKLDWNQLGYAKLKDLIMSMSDQIKLELIGPNHTLAYLIYSNRYHHQNGVHSDDMQNISRYKMLISDYQKRSVDYQCNVDTKNNLLVSDSKTLEEILTLFYQMLKEFPMGIESSKIVPWISQNLRQQFDFKTYNCNSLYEFINKFIMPTTEITIINNKPDLFLLRSKQIYSNVQTSSNASSYQMKNHSNSSLDQSNNSISTNNSKKYIKKQPAIDSSQRQENSYNNKVATNQDFNEKQETQPQLYAQSYLTKQTGYPDTQIRRMPSDASTFHMPGPSSFYGQNNDDSQQQTQINISHMRTNTEGEFGESQNTTSTHHQHQQSNQDQQINGLLPSHFYSSSTEYYPQPQEWTGDKMRHFKPQNNLDSQPNNSILDTNGRKKVSHPQQTYKQSTFGNFIGSPIQALPENFNNSIFGAAPFGINHEQNYSYSSNEGGGGGAGFLSFTNNNGKNIQQPNFNQFYPIFDKIDSTSNSPKHNRAMSYLYNNSISSSQDQSLLCHNNQLSVSLRNSFAHNSGAFNQKHGFNASIKQSGLEVYNEASKESSLEGAISSGKHSKKGQEEHIDVDIQDEHEQNAGNSHDIVEDVDEELIPNTSIEEGIKDENQSAVTSRFIEDLLGDEDQTDNDENSQKTTVVHTPHLSISSFYQQLPQAQGSSFNPANTPNQNNQNSTFENSNENDEANEQIIMNNLMIQVGHKSDLKQQQTTSNVNQFPQYQSQTQQFIMPADHQTNLHRNMHDRALQSSKYLKELQFKQPQSQFEQQSISNHDDAQYMHSKTLSEDFASNSIFSNQFVFDNQEQQPVQVPMQQQFQEQQISVQVVRPPKINFGMQQQLPLTTSVHHTSTPVYNSMQNFQGNQQYTQGNFKNQQQYARINVEIKQPAGPPSASYYNSNAIHYMGRNDSNAGKQTTPMNFTPMPKSTNHIPSSTHYPQHFPSYQQQQQTMSQPYQQQNQYYGHYPQQPQAQHYIHQNQQRFPLDQQNIGKRMKNQPQNNGKYF